MDLKLWEYIFEMFNYKIRQKKSIFSKLQTPTPPLKTSVFQLVLGLIYESGNFYHKILSVWTTHTSTGSENVISIIRPGNPVVFLTE